MAVRKYVLEDQIGFLLRKANQRHRAIFSRMVTPKLAPAQFAAMVKLYTDGPLPQNQLGRLVAMDSATITGVVNRLARRGWVMSGADEFDARLSLVELTGDGRDVIEALLPQGNAISKATLTPLTQHEGKVLIDLLRRISAEDD